MNCVRIHAHLRRHAATPLRPSAELRWDASSSGISLTSTSACHAFNARRHSGARALQKGVQVKSSGCVSAGSLLFAWNLSSRGCSPQQASTFLICGCRLGTLSSRRSARAALQGCRRTGVHQSRTDRAERLKCMCKVVCLLYGVVFFFFRQTIECVSW